MDPHQDTGQIGNFFLEADGWPKMSDRPCASCSKYVGKINSRCPDFECAEDRDCWEPSPGNAPPSKPTLYNIIFQD